MPAHKGARTTPTKAYITTETILAVIKATGPYPTKISENLGISYRSLHARLERNKKLKDAMDEARESFLDLAESTIKTAMINGGKNGTMAALGVLRMKGQSRGYVVRVENTGLYGGPIRHALGPDLEGMSDVQLQHYIDGLGSAANTLKSLPAPSGADGSDSAQPDEEDFEL
jgi:hypothetical protein